MPWKRATRDIVRPAAFRLLAECRYYGLTFWMKHLTRSGDNLVDEQDWSQFTQPADTSGSALTYAATHTGFQTSGVYSGPAVAYPPASTGFSASLPIFDGLSPVGNSPYSSSSSPAVSAHSNIALYEYAPLRNSPNPYDGRYVSPGSLQEASSPGGTMGLGDSEPITLNSPLMDFGSLTETPKPLSDGGDACTSGPLGYANEGSPPNKRAKTGTERDVVGKRNIAPAPFLGQSQRSADPSGAGPSNAGGTASQGKIKLRSASRTSKNVAHRPDETSEERKSRAAHNLVEKQYRNRLNAQFEGLLNSLPESLRSPGGTLGPSDSDPGPDLGERRLSKGDVLELSTTYIRMLERDCGRLEKERDDLTRDIERLQSMFINQGMPSSEAASRDKRG